MDDTPKPTKPTTDSAISRGVLPSGGRPVRGRELRWVKPFFKALQKTGFIQAACKAAKVNRSTVRERREADPAFDAEVVKTIEDARADQAEELMSHLMARAYRADQPLFVALKALMPDLFGDKQKIDVTHTESLTEEKLAYIEQQRARLAEELAKLERAERVAVSPPWRDRGLREGNGHDPVF